MPTSRLRLAAVSSACQKSRERGRERDRRAGLKGSLGGNQGDLNCECNVIILVRGFTYQSLATLKIRF